MQQRKTSRWPRSTRWEKGALAGFMGLALGAAAPHAASTAAERVARFAQDRALTRLSDAVDQARDENQYWENASKPQDTIELNLRALKENLQKRAKEKPILKT